MAGIDIERHPFLRAEQITGLEEAHRANLSLEFPQGDQGSIYDTLMVNSLSRAVSTLRVSRKQKHDLIGHSAADIETALQGAAYMVTMEDYQLEYMRHMASIVTAMANLQGRAEDEQAGHELGQRIIYDRAHKTALVAVLAGTLLVDPAPSLGDVTLFQQAKNVFASVKRVKPPVEIPEQEGDRLDALFDNFRGEMQDEGSSSMPRARGRLATIGASLKKGKSMYRQSRQSDNGTTMVDMARLLYENNFVPAGLDLTLEDIQFANMATSKMLRYIGGAAVLDRSIAADPRARFMAYIKSALRHTDHRSETAVFQRDVNKYAKRERARRSAQREKTRGSNPAS